MELVDIKDIWPDWQITNVIKKGSIGTVYKAKRENFNETFYSAIKIIKIPKDENELQDALSDGANKNEIKVYYKSYVQELINSMTLLESLKGARNILGIDDYKVVENKEEIGWTIYIRTDLLTNIKDYFSKEVGMVTEEKVLNMAVDVCIALENCQKANVVHCNLKPENIFVSKFGEFKLGDFSLAKYVSNTNITDVKKIDNIYIAPEVYKGKSPDFKSDIYSLGIIMYKLLNNNRIPFLPEYPQPITYSDTVAALSKRMSGQLLPKPKNMSNAVYNIITKMCSPVTEERYKNVTQVKEELSKVLATIQKISNKEDLNETVSIFSSKLKQERLNKFKANNKIEENNTEMAKTETVKKIQQDKDMTEKKVENIQPKIDVKVSNSKEIQKPNLENKQVKPKPEVKIQKEKVSPNKKSNNKIYFIIGIIVIVIAAGGLLILNKDKNEDTTNTQENVEIEQTQQVQIKVPNVVNMDLETAKSILETVGFVVEVEEVEKEEADTIKLGNVKEQSLEADSKAYKGSTINLKVIIQKQESEI